MAQFRTGHASVAELYAPTAGELLEKMKRIVEVLEEEDAPFYAHMNIERHDDSTVGVQHWYGQIFYEFFYEGWEDYDAEAFAESYTTAKQIFNMVVGEVTGEPVS